MSEERSTSIEEPPNLLPRRLPPERQRATEIVVVLLGLGFGLPPLLIALLNTNLPGYTRVGLAVAGTFLLILLPLGYTVFSGAIGFGPHYVKTTQTWNYKEDDNKWQLNQATYEQQSQKTIWDWMTVLTISTVIAAAALIFTSSQAAQQRYVQDQQARDAALLAYLEEMSRLIFDRYLLATHGKGDTHDEGVAPSHEAVHDVARARTLVALLAVGPERKRDVVRFLYEAELIKTPDRVVDLKEANLTDADFEKMPLTEIDLGGTNLSDGFDEDTRGAVLRKADLQGARLVDANLKGANLKGANLNGAIFEDGATMDRNSEVLNQQDAHLQGATMPNGQKYEDWLKSKGSGEAGENSGPS